jgi:hypothetical protein
MPPSTRQADVVVQSKWQANNWWQKNMTYQPLEPFVNICEMALLSSGTFKTGFLRLGNKHIEITLKNNSKYTMDHVLCLLITFPKKEKGN